MMSDWMRRAFLENWGLKTVSFLIALLLWLFVVGEKQSDVHMSLPLVLDNLPRSMIVTSNVPNEVSVRVTGPRTIIATMKPSQYRVSLDLQGIKPGTSSYELLASRFGFPRGVRVSDISPSVVTIVADSAGVKELPVKPVLKGLPADGYEVSRIEVEPELVNVIGPEKALKLVRELSTEALDITGADGGITREVELLFPGPSFKLEKRTQITIKVTLSKIKAQREFIDIPIIMPPSGWSVTPSKVTVSLTGEVDVLSQLSAKDITVGISGPLPANRGGDLVPVRVTLPSGAELVEVMPESVFVKPSE
ncbi:MAG: hypothetical protein C0608_12030 [Deltaproteobacteria bacterium]|nr:MAG: hypothetical protein C0608_12030 [Deltaproteobacteria bacterium]